MMKLLPAFAFSYFFFLTAPVVLRVKLGRGPTPTAGSMLDILTPFVLIGLYALLYRTSPCPSPTRRGDGKDPPRGYGKDPRGYGRERLPDGPLGLYWSRALFAFFAILFVEGHGMHLSANSISTVLTQANGPGAYAIAFFYDEVLSHYLLRLGALGLTGVILYRHWMNGAAKPRWAILSGASVVYGLTYAIAAVESQTVPVDLPASLAIAAIFVARWWRGRAMPGDAVFAFFGLACALAVVALAAWGVYFSGFPEPSELLGY